MAATDQHEMSAPDLVREFFHEHFRAKPEIEGIAPGRVNLIGEHTDYNDGFVFPAAIDRNMWISARRTEGRTTLYSVELGEGQPFDAASVSPGDVEGWAAYAAGIAWALRERTGQAVPNIEAVVHGEVPIASGISSSAAIELAFAVVWNKLAGFNLPNKELAKVGQICENKFVGLNSGIMDQMASAMGKKDHAMFLDTRSLEITYARIPTELRIVLCDTGKQRELTDSAYNERRRQCEEAAKELGVKSLRDADCELLESRRASLSDLIYRRAKHVITENERCQEFVQALSGNDLARIGELMKASHLSLRDDYEVSCPELDTMAESAWASDGCVGARMTGAGFGGACVALVEADKLSDFVVETAMKYKKSSGLGGNFIACLAADGARVAP